MSNTQYIGGGITQHVWRPRLIKLTAAKAKTFIHDTPIFVDPSAISMIRKLPHDTDAVFEDCTYVLFSNTGVYVKEDPDTVNQLRAAALDGKNIDE